MTEIESLTRTLIKTFGVKTPVPEKALRILYEAGLYGECIREIMVHFNIPLRLKVKCLPGSQSIERYLGKPEGGQESPAMIDATTSEIIRPGGHTEKVLLNATMYVKKDSIMRGFEFFMFLASHELSHLLMYSRNCPLANNEKATDILTLIMGFRKIAKSGRVTQDMMNIYILGYLNDDEFNHALAIIEGSTI